MNITFYSYKGGVGRSLALMSTALCMAQMRERVACIDLDLEAPGLNQIIDLPVSRERGLIQFLLRHDLRNLNQFVLDLKDHLSVDLPEDSALYLLPTCPDIENYSVLRWEEAQPVLNELLNQLRTMNLVDYFLIDSRSGLSDAGGWAVDIADLIVVLFRLNRQNLDGVNQIVHLFDRASRKFILVASSVPPYPGGSGHDPSV